MKLRLLATTMIAAALLAPQLGRAEPAPVTETAREVPFQPAVTRHQGKFGGVNIRYTATVEAVPVRTEPEGSSADVVGFSYTRDDVKLPNRPVMFLFNGGPITPSPYLHIGGLGPKRIAFPDDVKADPSTFKLVDNAYSPLDSVDLVFVDPAGTGFSRVSGGTEEAAFFSNKTDARQFSAYIRAWLKKNGREGAPVYILGESYGTHRAAAIADELSQGASPLPLAGIFLYGQAVNVIEWSQRPANITSYVASLPTIAAIGWYHRKVDRRGLSLEAFTAEAAKYAKGEYLTALYRGSDLPDAERRIVAARLEAFSGIPAHWSLENGLKITKERYRVELFKNEKLVLGRSDARYAAPITDKGGAVDPSDVLPDAIAKFFQTYMRDTLKVTRTETYRYDSPVPGIDAWSWGTPNLGPFGDFPYYEGISKVMRLNPGFKLMIGNGYYDTQTTLGGAELLATQSGWDPARVSLRFYDGGHMGYSVDATARKIGEDIRAFVR